MNNVASDLFLLTTNLSQLKNRDKIVQLFIDSIPRIFIGYSFKWYTECEKRDDFCLPVCTRIKTYGFIQYDSIFHAKKKQFALFQNATQLIAIILEHLEQDELLSDQKVHLQQLVDEQTNHLIEKQDELNEMNEEFATINEELIETNKSLIELNQQLQSEILEREKAEMELRKSEEESRETNEYLYNLFTFGNAPIMVWDNCFVITHFNPAFEQLSSYSAAEVIGKNIDVLFSKQNLETLIPNLINTVNNQRWNNIEIEIQRKDGGTRNILWNSSNIFDKDRAEIIATIAQGYDITERKMAEEAIRESEQLFSNIFYNSPVAMSITSRGDGKIVDANKTFLSGLEFTRDEVVGKSIMELGIFYDPGLREKLIENLIKNGFVNDFECPFLTKTGQIMIGLMSMSFILYQGKPHQLTTVIDITERKKAEVWLQNSERLLNESQRISGIGSYVLDIITGAWSGSIFLNEMFGIDENDDHSLEGMVSNIHPNDQVMITSYFINHVIGEKERFDKEFRLLTKNGKQIRWMHAVGELEFDLKGSAVKMIGTIQDITNRKLVEIALHDSERLLNDSQRISDIGSYTLDIPSGIWIGSEYLNEMFGIDDTYDHSVEGWMSLIHPEDLAMMSGHFTNDVLEGKGRFDKEYRIISKKSLVEKWVHGIGELEFDKDGNPIKMYGTIRDITERKKTDDELRKLLRAVEQSPDSIVITNISGVIEYANPAILKLSGYSSEELIGKNQKILGSGEKSKKEYKILWDTISSGNIWQGEILNKKKNGELYWESTTISPVLDTAGLITHYLAISEDITEKKKLTQELIEAKEHAEESDRLKSSFLANMSHEIRTPMNSIMGFASLLPEEESRELMCQYANIIVQNSEQLVSLIDGIVMYSKLQTGLFMYRPVLFIAHNLFIDIQQSFNLPVYQKEVTLKFVCNIGERTQIFTDYDKLRQIITNLTVNAFKYTHKGEITLGCDHKDDRFVFFVRDTGIGIPQKDLPHIFERFYRGSNIDEVSTRGTGLGLCIVKELVEMLGGTIWVESDPVGDRGGKGSTFYFTIPIMN